MSEQPEDSGLPDIGQLAEDQAPDPGAAGAIDLRQMLQAQGWRPVCVNCLNNHKLAISRISKKLVAAGVQPGNPQFQEALQESAQWGQIIAQNPMALQGMNGQEPDIIPVVRPADVFVNGNSVCAFCFMPQEQIGGSLLLPGSPHFRIR